MNTNDTQLQQAIEQMGRMTRALAALHTEVLPQSRQQFALMAEGPLEEIRRLEQTVCEYVDQTLDTTDTVSTFDTNGVDRMNDNTDIELVGTAWHEAGHTVALKNHGIEVDSVEVTTFESGVTKPNSASHRNVNLTNDQIAKVILAGIYAESFINSNYSVDTAIKMLVGSSSDRLMLYKLPGGWWHSQGSIEMQVAHNRAEKFVQDNKTHIERVADALLAKGGFPKMLTEQEVNDALNP